MGYIKGDEEGLTKNFVTIECFKTVTEAARKLEEAQKLAQEPGDWYIVVRSPNSGFAVLSKQDFLEAYTVHGKQVMTMALEDVHDPPLLVPSFTVRKMDQGIGEARKVMWKSYKNRLVVLDEKGELFALLLYEHAGGGPNQSWEILSVGQAEPPPPPAPPVTPRKSKTMVRYINLWFTRPSEDQSVIDSNQALVINQSIYLWINIGPYDRRTLLVDAQPFVDQIAIERAFPETKGKPIPLEVTIFSSDFQISMEECIQKITLNLNEPTETIYFNVKPIRSGSAHIRVCVFYKNHLLQSLTLQATVAPVAGRVDKPHSAHVEMTFSADFSNALQLSTRGLWLGINQSADGSHALNIKGCNNALICRLDSNRIENALTQARQALLQVSFNFEDAKDGQGKVIIDNATSLPQKKKIYRFDQDNFPTSSNRTEQFKDDLIKLADAGQWLFQAVFGSVTLAQELPRTSSLRNEIKQALNDEQVIQVTRLKNLGDIWPWALMYDLEIDVDNVHDVCYTFRGENGRFVPFAECIKKCKHRDPSLKYNDRKVICPYGFWGIKHVIEQPVEPGGKEAFEDLISVINIASKPVLEMPLATELYKDEPAHIQKMKELRFRVLDTKAEITDAFESNSQPPPPEPHAVYFFCHGSYDSNKNPLLKVGSNELLRPTELRGLNWHNSHGLVFINGCHTVDLSPNDLSAIMEPFILGFASGIIGTEITVHSYLARQFAQDFFMRFLPNGKAGQSVGTIIKDLRRELLMKYNPLGLVYTPYCSADLCMSR